MPISKQQVLGFKHGTILHYGDCKVTQGPRGGITQTVTYYRVAGNVKQWKRSESRFEVPIKHGLYASAYLTDSNADKFHLPTDCPVGAF